MWLSGQNVIYLDQLTENKRELRMKFNNVSKSIKMKNKNNRTIQLQTKTITRILKNMKKIQESNS